jgi:molecular chaperone HtpG
MKAGQISVQTENIFPIIKKFLYSDHEIFLRELVSNAVDACQKVKTLSRLGEIETTDVNARVEVILDTDKKTLTIRDNGIGMTEAEVDQYINQIAFSGAEEFVSKYKDAQIIGHFGLGFYSAFMVAKEVEIITLSHKKDAQAVRWVCDGSPSYSIESVEKTTPGTDIILHLADDSLEFNDESKLKEILDKYCRFMPVEIVFGEESNWIEDPNGEKDENGNAKKIETKQPRIINSTNPLWIQKPNELTDEDYKGFYHELYPMSFEEPLFHIHINVDYPFNLTGILFFPKLKNQMEVQRNKIQLYCNQVFITDEVKNILPDFLTLLHGVVDSPDIPLNVSRSYLQADGNVKKISAHITKKVADKLLSMFNNDRADFENKWDDINVFIQYGILTEEKFAEKAGAFTLYKNTTGEYKTLEEWKEKIGETQKDKNGKLVYLYTTDENAQHSAIEMATARGYEVFVLNNPLTAPFLSQIESKNSDITFKRVDSDIPEKLIEKETNEISALTDAEKENVKNQLSAWMDTQKFMVQFENMSPNDPPMLITENEFMRRMKEQQALGGGAGIFGNLPDSYQLIINTNHPAVHKMQNADGDALAKEALALAQLSKGLLKGSELTAYIQQAYSRLNAN